MIITRFTNMKPVQRIGWFLAIGYSILLHREIYNMMIKTPLKPIQKELC